MYYWWYCKLFCEHDFFQISASVQLDPPNNRQRSLSFRYRRPIFGLRIQRLKLAYRPDQRTYILRRVPHLRSSPPDLSNGLLLVLSERRRRSRIGSVGTKQRRRQRLSGFNFEESGRNFLLCLCLDFCIRISRCDRRCLNNIYLQCVHL